MATISDLFKSQKDDLYGKSDNIRIESKGLINIPRAAALLTSSPNPLGDLIGNQIGGALGGSANRPSDTIFKGNEWYKKPISLFKTQAQLRDAIEPGTSYFIKKDPSPASLFAQFKQGATSPIGMLANIAVAGIQKYGSKKGIKKLSEALNRPDIGVLYGAKYDTAGKPTDVKKQDTYFSEYNRTYTPSKPNDTGIIETNAGRFTLGLDPRGSDNWDDYNNIALDKETLTIDDEDRSALFLENARGSNQVWITFKKMGSSTVVPFAGAITGISEDITPEWTSFKYIGSPFKTHRYGGVERSLKFNLKVYYNMPQQKATMIKKINYLKSLAFPNEEISAITTNGVGYQYAFTPNLFFVSIGDMYRNVLGKLDSISFAVDDNTPWPNDDVNMDGESIFEPGKKADGTLYPSIIDVSFSMKIIETHQTVQENGITKYKYNFDGLSSGLPTIPENQIKKSAAEMVKFNDYATKSLREAMTKMSTPQGKSQE
jgi:hypothetical protein